MTRRWAQCAGHGFFGARGITPGSPTGQRFTWGQIRPASGDWGLVDLGDMPRVFPGLRLPKAQLRSTFAVRLVRETLSVAADFHAIGYRPLFSVKL